MADIRVLVVDDEDMIRVNLEAFLEDEGFTVSTANSGEAGVEILKHKQFDIAVVDMRLPGIDGNTVILEGSKLQDNCKFVIHTGSSEYVLPQELLDIGISEDQILLKPLVEMEELITTMDRLLKS